MSNTLDEIMAKVGVLETEACYAAVGNRGLEGVHAARDFLRTRLAALVADAERYENLKQSYTQCGAAWIAIGISEDDPDKWDDIIDAARATQQTGE